MNSRSLLTVAIFGLLLNFAVAEDEEGGAASSGKNEARLLVGKHVRENFWIKKILFFNNKNCCGNSKIQKINFYFGTKEIILSWILVTLYEIVIKCIIF